MRNVFVASATLFLLTAPQAQAQLLGGSGGLRGALGGLSSTFGGTLSGTLDGTVNDPLSRVDSETPSPAEQTTRKTRKANAKATTNVNGDMMLGTESATSAVTGTANAVGVAAGSLRSEGQAIAQTGTQTGKDMANVAVSSSRIASEAGQQTADAVNRPNAEPVPSSSLVDLSLAGELAASGNLGQFDGDEQDSAPMVEPTAPPNDPSL